MNFVFISPNFPEAFRWFCIRLRDNGVNVLGVGDASYAELHPDLKGALTEYYKVGSLENYDEVLRALGYFTGRYGKMDWVESNNEYWLELDAALRTDFNITTGLKKDEIAKYKRKSAMKAYYRQAGIPTARSLLVTQDTTLEQILAFTAEVGYPAVAKPDNGVGAIATYKLKSDADAEAFFAEKPDNDYLMEEYVPGAVTTYDGVCNSKGEVLFAASHITRNSIMDMVNEGVPTYYYVDKDVPADVERAGKATLKAFGVKSRCFHLEFFRLTEDKPGLGKTGDIVALEVNMRPAGGFTPDMLNFSQSADMYQIYADMVAFDEARHTYDGPHSYCVYAGRRDENDYVLSLPELEYEYRDAARLFTRMPDALAGTMGNQVAIACFDTLDEVDEFVRRAFALAPPPEEDAEAAETEAAAD
ncbi:MAG: carbamoylphosphate synthase large subunit [Oscillospiraceae bacterium]|nr:carbamoylphosphate synthase large subunit [Oscillospiraceae bacterium]